MMKYFIYNLFLFALEFLHDTVLIQSPGDYVRAAEKTDTYEQEQKYSECAGHI